jgi:GTP-binding protein EngB required for normal cell division
MDGTFANGPVLDRLHALSALAAEMGEAALAEEAAQAATRLAEGRFHVVAVGQFKRGKSTLLNALVGEPILPMGVTPVTTVITILRHGSARAARVYFRDGRTAEIAVSAIETFVSEAHNPRNVKQVKAVEVTLPSPLLAAGMCLVDTPGVGSVFEANTAVTLEFVPHIDAALVVLGADPPISGDEMRLLEAVAERIDELVFVLNKADRLGDAELAEAVHFTRGVIAERLDRAPPPVFEVSAIERLRGGAPTRDLRRLESTLLSMATGAGGRIVEASGRRALDRLAGRLRRVLEERRDALVRPIAESASRLDRLREWQAGAERALKDLGHLFAAVHDDAWRTLDGWRREFVATHGRAAAAELERRLAAEPVARAGLERRRAHRLAREVARRAVHEWLHRIEPEAEALYAAAVERLVALAADFVARIGAEAGVSLDAPRREAVGLHLPRHFYFHDLLTLTTPSVVERVGDLLVPRARRAAAIRRQSHALLERLLDTNSHRVISDLRDRIVESSRGVEAEIRARLAETLEAAARAIELARARRDAGQAAVEAELAQLDAWHRRLEAMHPARQPAGGG